MINSGNKSKSKRGIALATCLLLVLAVLSGLLVGCVEKQEGKTVVTLLSYESFNCLEELIEDTYTDIDFRFETYAYPGEILRRLQKGVGSDLVLLEDFSARDCTSYLQDISDTVASISYDGTVMQQLKIEGKTYVIPLPGEYNGYIVNKTLFDREGIELPTTNDELISALVALKAKAVGIGEDGYNFAIESDSNTDLGKYILSCAIPDFLGTVEGVKWLVDYNAKSNSATMNGKIDVSFELIDKLMANDLIDSKAISKERNSILYDNRLADGTLVAAFGGSDIYNDAIMYNEQGVASGDCEEYKYVFLPILSNTTNSSWLMRMPSGYFGINKMVSGTTKEACVKILNLVSTVAGQDAIIEDMNRNLSYLQDYVLHERAIPNGAESHVSNQFIYNMQFPDSVMSYLGKKGQEYIKSNIVKNENSLTIAEVLLAVDEYHYNGSVDIDYGLNVIGAISSDMLFENYNTRLQEAAIGNFIADAVAEVADAPIAVVNGGAIRSSFYEGELYGYELADICPFGNLVTVVEMNGETLWAMLENGLALYHSVFPAGRFLQVSGISYTFNGTNEVGSRLVSVRLADGTPISMTDIYKVAVNDFMLGKSGYVEGNGDGYTMLNYYDDVQPKGNVTLIKETQLTYAEALKLFFENRIGVTEAAVIEGRIINEASEK